MTVTRLLPALLLLALAVAAAGCGDPDAGAEAAPDLDGREFAATRTTGHEQVAETEITLSFGDGRISATAGCNTMTGGATWDDGVLTSEPALSLSDGVLSVGDDTAGLTMQEQA